MLKVFWNSREAHSHLPDQKQYWGTELLKGIESLPYIFTCDVSKCCLWGLWFSDCNRDCWLVRNAYLRGMGRRKYFHGISLCYFPSLLYKRQIWTNFRSHLVPHFTQFWLCEGAQHKSSKLSKSVRPACPDELSLGLSLVKRQICFWEASSITSKLSKEPYPSPCNEFLDSHDLQASYIRRFHFSVSSHGPRMVSFCWSYVSWCFANCKHSIKGWP